MREEIRQGNEALARNDLDEAVRCFQQVLVSGGTELQKRIAVNRLRDIQRRRAEAEASVAPSNAKKRPRRKPSSGAKRAPEPEHRFVRPPDDPVVVIRIY